MLAIVSIFPIGKGESLGREVSGILKIIDRSGLDYRLTAMGTILEGEWEPVMRTVKKLRDHLLKNSKRVYLTLAIDDRKGARGRISGKVERVETLLGKKLKK